MPRLRSLPPRIATLDTRSAKPPVKIADPFYHTPEWRALVSAIKRHRGNRCETCGAAGIRLFGDHVIELRDGGAPLDPLNVRVNCGSCHSKKTAAERAKRMAR